MFVLIGYGSVIAAMGAVMYWGPKLWGRQDSGQAGHRRLALLGLLATVSRHHCRCTSMGSPTQPRQTPSISTSVATKISLEFSRTVGHALMALTVLAFIGLAVKSFASRAIAVGDDPWDAQTLEWATTSPAPEHNFVDRTRYVGGAAGGSQTKQLLHGRRELLMLALPPAPAPAPSRQLFVGTAVACVAGATLIGGCGHVAALPFDAASPMAPGYQTGIMIPEVASNIMLFSFIGIWIFAQWAVYAARRNDKLHVAMAFGLTGLIGLAVDQRPSRCVRTDGIAHPQRGRQRLRHHVLCNHGHVCRCC